MNKEELDKRNRSKLLEESKKNKKNNKGKNRLSGIGLGSIEDGKESYGEAAKQTGIHIAAGVAGGLAGTAIGKPAMLLGIIGMAASALIGSSAMATASTGMMFGSLVKPTEAQQNQLNKEHPLKEGDTFDAKREQARASFALTTALDRIRDATYVFAKKTNTKKDDGKGAGDKPTGDKPASNPANSNQNLGWVTANDTRQNITVAI